MKMQSIFLLAAVLVLSVVNGQVITTSDLVVQLSQSPTFSILKDAVNASGLAPVLKKNVTVITVFAPDNSGFQALFDSFPEDPSSCLLSTTKGKAALQTLLKYHVVASNITLPLKNTSAAKTYNTLADASISLQSFPNGTTVVNKKTTVSTANLIHGPYYVVHAVSGVILPSNAAQLVLGACPKSLAPAPAPSPESTERPPIGSTPGITTETPPAAPAPPSGATHRAVPMVLLTLASAMALFLLKP